MSSGYLYNDKPIEEQATLASDILTRMVGEANTFTLTNKGFTSTDTTKFISATGYNNNTWGTLLTTEYKYQNESVPFVDPRSIPNYCLIKSGGAGGTFLRRFPESDWADDEGTFGKFISPIIPDNGDTLTISYNEATESLIVTEGTTEHLQVKASPYVLIDIQTPGGDGGINAGAYSSYWGFNYHAVAGGGGGASGGFASLSANLTKQSTTEPWITIKHEEDEASNYHRYMLTSSLTSDILYIGKGGKGANGYASITNHYVTTASAGAGGAPHKIFIKGSSTNSVSFEGRHLSDVSLGNRLHLIDSKVGYCGAAGTCRHGKWNDISSSDGQESTSQESTTPDSNMSLMSSSAPSVPCVLLTSLSVASAGSGQQSSTSNNDLVCGGGGGGASLMSNGGTYGRDRNDKVVTASGIGAGGFGESGYASRTEAGNSLKEAGKGGPGALWLYYKPLSLISPKITTTYTNPNTGASFVEIYNDNPVEVTCVCTNYPLDGTNYTFRISSKSKQTDTLTFPKNNNITVQFSWGKLTSTAV